jgi:hypothetical protein
VDALGEGGLGGVIIEVMKPAALVISLGILCSLPVIAASPPPPPLPLGAEIAVNDPGIPGSHRGPRPALFSDGSFVVVWNDTGAKTSVHARFFRADGTAASGEFRLFTPSASGSVATSVVVDRDDSFLVAWQDVPPGQGQRILVKRFSRTGQPLGPALQVNAPSLFPRFYAQLALRPGGGFVVAWNALEDHITHTEDAGDIYAYDVYARAYTADGTPLGPEFFATERTFDDQELWGLAVGPDGVLKVLCITWDQAPILVLGRFTPRGRQLGKVAGLDIAVDGRTAGLAMAPDGTFTVAWTAYDYVGDLREEIVARRFAADGSPLSQEVEVNAYHPGHQVVGDLAALPDGGFVVVWKDDQGRPGSGPGIYARPFGADGKPLFPRDIRVSQTTTDVRFGPVIAGRDGRFVVAWSQRDGAESSPQKVRARVLAGN